MNMNKLNLWAAIAAMWIATGAAVVIAVYATKNVAPLWFFLMPLIGGAHIMKEAKDRE